MKILYIDENPEEYRSTWLMLEEKKRQNDIIDYFSKYSLVYMHNFLALEPENLDSFNLLITHFPNPHTKIPYKLCLQKLSDIKLRHLGLDTIIYEGHLPSTIEAKLNRGGVYRVLKNNFSKLQAIVDALVIERSKKPFPSRVEVQSIKSDAKISFVKLPQVF